MGLAAYDPTYSAPERRFAIFKAALRLDAYSIAPIALRVVLGSQLDAYDMYDFVNATSSQGLFSFSKTSKTIAFRRNTTLRVVHFDLDASTIHPMRICIPCLPSC